MLARSCLRSTRILNGARNGAATVSKVRTTTLEVLSFTLKDFTHFCEDYISIMCTMLEDIS